MLIILGHVWLTSANWVNLSMFSVMSMGKDKLIQTIFLEQMPNFTYFYLLLRTLCVCLSLFPHIAGGHLDCLRKVVLVNTHLRTVAESKFQYVN